MFSKAVISRLNWIERCQRTDIYLIHAASSAHHVNKLPELTLSLLDTSHSSPPLSVTTAAKCTLSLYMIYCTVYIYICLNHTTLIDELIFECFHRLGAADKANISSYVFIMHITSEHTYSSWCSFLSLPCFCLSPSLDFSITPPPPPPALIALVMQQRDSDNEGFCPWTWSKALLLTGMMSCSFLVPSPQSP